MQIMINHMSRLRGNKIAVAGLDLSNPARHVRPMLNEFDAILETRLGGTAVFSLGAVVNLTGASNAKAAHHGDEHVVTYVKARKIAQLHPLEVWRTLGDIAKPTLTSIFGDAVKFESQRFVIEKYRARSGLGCLRIMHTATLYKGYRQARLRWVCDGRVVDCPVTDTRLYDRAGVARDRTITSLDRRIKEGEALIVTVGLSRGFRRPGGRREFHWIQVNNIYLETDPLGDDWAPQGD